MDDLTRLADLVQRIVTLEEQLGQMKRHHLQFVTVLTKGLGGELRVAQEDYRAAIGCTLAVRVDAVTGDTVFQVSEPETTGQEVGHG